MAIRIRDVFGAALATLALALPAFAGAAFPDKPITIIVPYAPGGGADLLARLVGQKLSERLKQPVIVENHGGASNTIGMGLVSRADPDGYTLGLATPVFVMAPLGMKKKPYDPIGDFTPVAMIGFTPLVLVVHPSVKAHTVKEFIALAKANPGKLNFASLGQVTTQGLAASLFNQMAGIEAVQVPYKGSAPGVRDLLAGNVQYMFNALPSMLGHVKAGKLRGLGVSGAKRAPELPDVPTIEETLPGYRVTTWYSFVAPKGTPAPVVELLNREVNEIVKEPDVADKLQKRGVTSDPMTIGELEAHYKTEAARWAKVARDAKIQPE
ncbi:MAG TPA: tripartite tricarboxylate transporter substrate binding protein [Usitatibacter sp.]|nr:tripartite tricarboxylate transporter substrate binding protein [Usitatibacter sp.]